MPSLAERCRTIELLVLDVDGVLTDGGIVQAASEGDGALMELKQFHVRDGLGLVLWHKAGRTTALMSGRVSPVVGRRAAELGIVEVMQGIGDKGAALIALGERRGLRMDQIAFLGDDLIDVPALRLAGLGAAVADACPDAIAAAHHVTKRVGGAGAVREVVELVLRCQERWPTAG